MAKAPHIVEQPRWIFPVRIAQVVLAIAILGMSAYGIYWVAYAAWCLALFTALATFIIVAYNILTNMLPAVQVAYNYWAVLALDVFAAIFWLASMADLAATRTKFKYHTVINGCYNDGYGGVCYTKRDFERRDVATYSYLDMMSASAGLSALEMLLFILTLAIHVIHLQKHRAAGGPVTPNSAEKGQSNAMGNVSYAPVANPGSHTQQQYQAPQQPQQQQYAVPQQQQQQQPYAAPQPQSYQQPTQQYPQHAQSPAPQQYQQYPQPTASPPPQQYQYPSPTQSTAYQPSPVSTPTPHQAQPAAHELGGYNAPMQGYSEVSGERRA